MGKKASKGEWLRRQNKDQYVKIYSDHECLFKVGLETEININ